MSESYMPQVLASFGRLGFTPRSGQAEAVCQIVHAFLEEGITTAILSAPTGTGKSLIGAAVAETISDIRGRKSSSACSSISLTATNTLSAQYAATFSNLADGSHPKYLMLKGASNYECSALSTPEADENADACSWFTMVKSSANFAEILQNHCEHCEFKRIRGLKNNVRHLTTNYSYYFIDRMFSYKFERRDLVVWDEAHLVNDLFSEHNAIHFSQKRIQAFQKEIAETVKLTDLNISKTLTQLAADCAKPGKITERNFDSYLRALQSVYDYAKEQGEVAADRAIKSGQNQRYTTLSRFAKKYEGLSCKIADLFKFNYPHVFEYKEEDKSVSVKPVFIGNMIESLKVSDFNLFMSATISPEFVVTTMDLDKTKTKFIQLEPTFPKENKEIVFFDTQSLSYQTLQDSKVVDKLKKNVAKIAKHHAELGQRGIVLTPSFKLQNDIIGGLRDLEKQGKFRLFEHRQGTKLDETVTMFKAYSGGPAILISPSMFEGIDLPGELSRFQIMVKAPYPSLGDKRIKWILDNHKDVYEILAIMKITQGAGRSVRSAEDHAVTYFLDKNAERLFNSKQNIWKNEFSTRYTQFL